VRRRGRYADALGAFAARDHANPPKFTG
jgi:hypothetical protein